MIAGKKFMYLRNDEEMMCGKAGQGGICIFKTGQACIMGTYNQDMSPANNTKEVGKMAVRNAHTASALDPTARMLASFNLGPPASLMRFSLSHSLLPAPAVSLSPSRFAKLLPS